MIIRWIKWRHLSIGGISFLWMIACWMASLLSLAAARKGSSPDLSSTILQMHKLYTTNPPHDTKLYDILHVSPNATAAQITKSYRNLSRRYHPDKVEITNQLAQEQLKTVQEAYDILKDDATRLPYHQYGLTDPNVAVAILLGPHHHHNHLLDRVHNELLELMGYESYLDHPPDDEHQRVPLDAKSRRDQRVRLVAARLVERLRPLVEETVPPHLVAHQLAQECDEWKRLPLGAQVIRCIGRAYRHAGQDFLKQQQQQRKVALEYYSVPVRQQWRKAKAFWTAFLATGRASVTEQVWVQQEKKRRRQRSKKQNSTPQIDYHSQGLGNIDFGGSDLEEEEDPEAMFVSDNEGDGDDDEEERKYIELFRAKQTLLTSLQVEALWKVAKIDLDRVIRRACRLILTQEYFFFPSHQMVEDDESALHHTSHGWVTSRGTIMEADQALQKTAEALVFLGNVMVERSKADTSWKD